MFIKFLIKLLDKSCENSGKSIKLFAKIIGIIELICSVAGGFVLVLVGLFNFKKVGFLIFVGIIIAGILSFLVIAKTLLVYGFGEVVENSRDNSKNDAEKIETNNILE